MIDIPQYIESIIIYDLYSYITKSYIYIYI